MSHHLANLLRETGKEVRQFLARNPEFSEKYRLDAIHEWMTVLSSRVEDYANSPVGQRMEATKALIQTLDKGRTFRPRLKGE